MAENLIEWKNEKKSIISGVFQGYGPKFRRWMIITGGNFPNNKEYTFSPENLLEKTFNQDNSRNKIINAQERQTQLKQLSSILRQVKKNYKEREGKILSFFSDGDIKQGLKDDEKIEQGLKKLQQLWEGNYQNKQNDNNGIKENIIIEIEELLTNKVDFLMKEESFYQALLEAGNVELEIDGQKIILNDEDYQVIRAFTTPKGDTSASSWFYIVGKDKELQKEKRTSTKGKKLSHFSLGDEELKFTEKIYQAIEEELKSKKAEIKITTNISIAELKDILGKEGESLEKQIINFLKVVMTKTKTWRDESKNMSPEVKNELMLFFEEVAEKFTKTKKKDMDIKKYWEINNERLEISRNPNFQGFSGELQNIIALLRISKGMVGEESTIKSIDFINTGKLTSYFSQYNQDTLVKVKYKNNGQDGFLSFGMQMKNPFERNIENNLYTAYESKEYKIEEKPHSTLIKYLEIKNWDYFLQVVLNTVDDPQKFEYFLYTFFENFMRLQADKIADKNFGLLAYTGKLKDWKTELENGTIFTDFYLVNRKIVPAYKMIEKLIEKINTNNNEVFSLKYTPPPISAAGKAEQLKTSKNLLANASITVKTVIPLD